MLPTNDLYRHNHTCDEAIAAAIDRVLRSGWYVLGNELEAFQAEFARYCGVAHCVGVASGSDALELALRALEVEAGAEVITVANAGMYGTSAILNTGAVPVYADVVPRALTMDSAAVNAALTPRTGAIIVTHLYGRIADLPAILELAARAGVPVVEDCAQAHGATLREGRAGSFGAVGCFSFYPTKNLGALGDAGAVVTDDAAIAGRLSRLRQYGWESKYVVALPGGRNSRLDELQAAILRTKLLHLDEWNARRRAIAGAYASGIANPDIKLPPPADAACVAHLFVVRAPRRDSLRRHLHASGIGTDVHYPVPDHRQPAYRDRWRTIDLPVTEAAAAQVLTLPCFPEMTEQEIQSVVSACNQWRG